MIHIKSRELFEKELEEEAIDEGMMSEIDIIAQGADNAADFVREVTEFLKTHAHDKSAATDKETIDQLTDTYFDKDGKKKKEAEPIKQKDMANNLTSQTPTSFRVQAITSQRADTREGRTEHDVLSSTDFESKDEAMEAYNQMSTGMENDKQVLAVYPMKVGEHTELIATSK
jgi:hypothetical protein